MTLRNALRYFCLFSLLAGQAHAEQFSWIEKEAEALVSAGNFDEKALAHILSLRSLCESEIERKSDDPRVWFLCGKVHEKLMSFRNRQNQQLSNEARNTDAEFMLHKRQALEYYTQAIALDGQGRVNLNIYMLMSIEGFVFAPAELKAIALRKQLQLKHQLAEIPAQFEARIYAAIVSVYANDKAFDQARATLDELTRRYPDAESIIKEASDFLEGSHHEAQAE